MIAELLAENPVLLAKLMHDLQLVLVHPAGDRDQHEPEWVQNSWHVVSSLSRAAAAMLTTSEFNEIQFPDHTPSRAITST
jgi:hypothetical protein